MHFLARASAPLELAIARTFHGRGGHRVTDVTVVSPPLSCYVGHMPFVALVALSDLPERRGVCISVGRCELAVFKVEGEVFALDNSCPHRGGPLSEGDIVAQQIFCPLHAWGFDLRTGRSSTSSRMRVRSYPVRLVDGRVEVELEEADLEGEPDDPESFDSGLPEA